ncbi:hypothetical protein C8C85_1258 [Flavobacterium sp. 103]|uniref:hypothetical protein n=1 Tax=Flavobacterium sp. 103 TaxID=2135624 RepID=UPI000D5F6501|nr:hypothetical protein [Flavobacterium sp. 103]PVX45463.1 hypothetical protein C8C85_1258 [Flavobacterium sp. 103]
MKKTFVVSLILCTIISQAQTLKLGGRFQKTQEMYWENGISAQYSFAKFKPNQFFIGFDYVTSRLGSAYNSNAIKQDNYIFSGSWQFNKNKPYHFVTRLNMGYFYSDLEEEIFNEIPNTAFLFSPEIGFTFNIPQVPVSLNFGTGYYIITEKEGYSPGTLQPLYFHLDIYYTLFKKHN